MCAASGCFHPEPSVNRSSLMVIGDSDLLSWYIFRCRVRCDPQTEEHCGHLCVQRARG